MNFKNHGFFRKNKDFPEKQMFFTKIIWFSKIGEHMIFRKTYEFSLFICFFKNHLFFSTKIYYKKIIICFPGNHMFFWKSYVFLENVSSRNHMFFWRSYVFLRIAFLSQKIKKSQGEVAHCAPVDFTLTFLGVSSLTRSGSIECLSVRTTWSTQRHTSKNK